MSQIGSSTFRSILPAEGQSADRFRPAPRPAQADAPRPATGLPTTRRRLTAAVAMALVPWVFTGSARAAPSASAPGRADFPNVALLNQDGQTVRFYDDFVRGHHTVAINFIYAQCGDICPMTMGNLARVQVLPGRAARPGRAPGLDQHRSGA